MRVTPLAVWASELLKSDIDTFKKVIVADTSLTHPCTLVQEAVFIYSAAIAHLV